MSVVVELVRLEEGEEGTFGVLLIDGRLSCYTLEPPDRGNAPDISSIPAGEYDLARRKSARFGETFEVLNVPGRTDVLFHAGNTRRDTRGCILLGSRVGMVGGERGVQESRAAVERFNGLLSAAGDVRLRVVAGYEAKGARSC